MNSNQLLILLLKWQTWPATRRLQGSRSSVASVKSVLMPSQLDLKAHLRIHSDKRSYKCTQCDERFKQAAGLSNHRKKHSEERPYKCTQYDKCFRWPSDLKRHLLIHTNERPFKYTRCKKMFPTLMYPAIPFADTQWRKTLQVYSV